MWPFVAESFIWHNVFKVHLCFKVNQYFIPFFMAKSYVIVQLIYLIIHLPIDEHLSYFNFLAILFSFCCCCCLIFLARTVSKMLSKTGKSEHLCLVPDHRWNKFSFSPSSLMLALSEKIYTTNQIIYMKCQMPKINYQTALRSKRKYKETQKIDI